MADLSVVLPGEKSSKIVKWHVKPGAHVMKGSVLALYKPEDSEQTQKLRCNTVGSVENIVISEGESAKPGELLVVLSGCTHPTVMKDMCAECGADLREEYGAPGDRRENVTASIAMVHSIPELIVSKEQAMELGQEDEERLFKNRKLVLLVDLDQTLIHTTNENVPPNLKDVFHFQLWQGPKQQQWYHTKIRPGTVKFLEEISRLYELHICTFGARVYAHTVTGFLDPEKKHFSHRILSRDECFNPTTKTANLKALFPRGDAMVCIIDDREDVWNFAPNLVHVKPYNFFEGTADINAPPGADKGLATSAAVPQRQVKVIKVPKKKKKVGQKDETKVDQGKKDSEEGEGEDEVMKEENSEVDKNSEETDSKNESKKVESNEQDVENGKVNEKEQTSEEPEKMETNETEKQEEESDKENQVEYKEEYKGVDTEAKKGGESDEYDEIIEWGDDDKYLENLERILKNIHLAYYQMHDEMSENQDSKDAKELPSLRNIIPYVRRKTLQNCRIVFTGVIPTNMPAEKHRLHVMAKNLGASIQKDFVPPESEESTTHMVAINRTKKLLQARTGNPDIHIVTPNWLWTCYEQWEKADEKDFHPFDKNSEDKNAEYKDSPKRHKRKRSSRHEQKKSPKLSGDDRPSSEDKVEDANENSSDSSESEGLREGTDSEAPERKAAAREQRKFSETYNPLYAFSNEDLAGMDREVEDLLDEDSESDSEEDENKRQEDLRKRVLSAGRVEDSSSEDSLSGNFPHGWGRKEKSASRSPSNADDDANEGEEGEVKGDDFDEDYAGKIPTEYAAPPSDSDDSDGSSIGSVDEEIAAALEREFLSR